MEIVKEIVWTNGIPVCPYCDKPTKRSEGMSTVTAMYFPPVYDEKGNNINPDKNRKTTDYYCYECDKNYSISGNYHDGFKYLKNN